MTAREMLVFAGAVLGPALVAREVADTLAAVPGAAPARPEQPVRGAADRLLGQVFPDGLPR